MKIKSRKLGLVVLTMAEGTCNMQSIRLSLRLSHLGSTRRRRLVDTGDSARIQDETAECPACFFNVLGVYSAVIRDLILKSRPKGNK